LLPTLGRCSLPRDTDVLSHRCRCRYEPLVGGTLQPRELSLQASLHKFVFDIWGDPVNTASRMESHGVAGRIQVGDAAYKLLKDTFELEPRGVIEIKGKGDMSTWFLTGELATE